MVLTKKKLRSSSSLMLIVVLLLVFNPVMFAASSSQHDESIQIKSSVTSDILKSPYCGQETCHELRERVESLEEAVRSIISALSDEKTPHFTMVDQKIGRSRAMRSSANQEKGNQPEGTSKISKGNGDSKAISHTGAGELKKKSGGTPIIKMNKKTNSDDQRNITTSREKSLEITTAKRNQSSINPNISQSQQKSRQNPPSTAVILDSIHHLKHAVKCSLAHVLDIHVSESSRANQSAGILNTTLHQAEKSIEIDWSPPSASCIEFITGLWVRVYESGNDQTSQPYLSIPRKCLKSKNDSSGREALSIVLPSNNSSVHQSKDDAQCNFLIEALVECRSYQLEVVPDYQSLRGKSIQVEIIIPPTMDTMARLESLMSVSALFDSLALNWEDNSGCASRLTSISLKLWSDGALPVSSNKKNSDHQVKSLDTSIEQPITYIIPRSCLKLVPNDGNLFSMTLSSSSNHSSCRHVQWEPLDKCRKYVLQMESQYSSSWTGPSSFQTIFTSITQDSSSRYPTEPFANGFTEPWKCSAGEIMCFHPHMHPKYNCRSYNDYVCNGGQHECYNQMAYNRGQHIFTDEQYCEDHQTCLSGFKCGRQCIPRDLLCNGEYDCLNGEDESFDHCDYLNSCQHITSPSGTFASMQPVTLTTTGQSESSNSFVRPYLVRKSAILISVKPSQIIWMDFAKWMGHTMKKYKVKLFDGPYSTSPLLLSHDDFKKPVSVRSSGPNLYVEYYSYQNETSGIKAYYTAMEKSEQPEFMEGCGGYVNGEGVVTSPINNIELTRTVIGVYQNLADHSADQCLWFIEARHSGGTLLLKKDSNQQHKLEHAHNLIVAVYDGWNKTGIVLYNGTVEKNKESIYSSSSKMLVRFDRLTHSKQLIQNSWNVTTIFTPHCKELLTESSGTVNSPNYPSPYPKSTDCRWTIAAAPGRAIRLLFAFFQTQEKRDFVYVYDGPTVYHPLLMEKSGTVLTPFVVNSSSNQVLVRFTSSDVGIKSFNGFLAVYSIV